MAWCMFEVSTFNRFISKLFDDQIWEAGFANNWPNLKTINIFIFRVPVIPDYLRGILSSENTEDDPFADDDDEEEDAIERDPLIDSYPKYLCPIFNGLNSVCLEDSILELFGKNGDITVNDTETLTNDEIINTINTRNVR